MQRMTHATQIDNFWHIELAMSKVDTENADAFHPSDRDLIADAVRGSAGGFTAVNGRIHQHLRSWLVQAARQLYESHVASLGASDHVTMATRGWFAYLLQNQGFLAEAEELSRENLRLQRALPARARTRDGVRYAMNSLAGVLTLRGEYDEAVQLYREVLKDRRDENITTLATMNNLASTLYRQQRYAESEPLYRDALRGLRVRCGEAHSNVLLCQKNLGAALAHMGRLEEAEAEHDAALRTSLRELSAKHAVTLEIHDSLADLRLLQGRREEAARMYADVLRCRVELLGGEHHDTVATRNKLQALRVQAAVEHSGKPGLAPAEAGVAVTFTAAEACPLPPP